MSLSWAFCNVECEWSALHATCVALCCDWNGTYDVGDDVVEQAVDGDRCRRCSKSVTQQPSDGVRRDDLQRRLFTFMTLRSVIRAH